MVVRRPLWGKRRKNFKVLVTYHPQLKCLIWLCNTQISGKPAIVRRALYDVSTLLHQNPKKDNPSMSFPLSQGGRGFRPIGPPIDDMPPRGNPPWSQRHYDSRDMPPMPWMGGYGDRPFEFGPDRFDRGPPMHGGEAPSEFSMKILCPVGKIGGVIGTGGSNVKQLETETGASVHVGDASAVLDERVIRVSSLEVGLLYILSLNVLAIETSDFHFYTSFHLLFLLVFD